MFWAENGEGVSNFPEEVEKTEPRQTGKDDPRIPLLGDWNRESSCDFIY